MFQVFFEKESDDNKENVNMNNQHNHIQNKNMKIESAFDIIFDPSYKLTNQETIKIPHLLIEDYIYENIAFS